MSLQELVGATTNASIPSQVLVAEAANALGLRTAALELWRKLLPQSPASVGPLVLLRLALQELATLSPHKFSLGQRVESLRQWAKHSQINGSEALYWSLAPVPPHLLRYQSTGETKEDLHTLQDVQSMYELVVTNIGSRCIHPMCQKNYDDDGLEEKGECRRSRTFPKDKEICSVVNMKDRVILRSHC